MNGTSGGIIGLLFGLVLAFGIDNCYFRPQWEENAKKQEQLKQYMDLAKMGYGEYQLDKYTGYSSFVWFGTRELIRRKFVYASESDLAKLENPYFSATYEIREKAK